MNIVKVMGGLGNQLFQYAFAKSLEANNEDPVALDITYYDSYYNHCDDIAHREYLLPCFVDGLQYGEQEKRTRVNQWEYNKDQEYKNCFFFGDWQKASFFNGLDLGIKLKEDHITKDAKTLADKMHQENSVAVHVRRTDYQKLGWLLDMSYYERAAAVFHNETENPVFYIFSDDLQYCFDCLPFYANMYVSKGELMDFWLMSQCKHNIIANSSYSFWAAYLNENPDKIVVYPKNWVIKMAHPVDCLDWRGV